MVPIKEINKLIDNYGDEIVSFADESKIKGIFTKSSDILPSLMPYIDDGEKYLGFYSKAENIPFGMFIYADKHYIAVARKSVEIENEPAFCQTLLRYKPIVEPPEPEPEPAIYPNVMTFGGFSVDLDIQEINVKQGSLIVNIAAINKFVTDRTVGSEPMQITVKGKVARENANSLILALKEPSSKSRQTLAIDGLVSMYAVVEKFSLTQSKTEEFESFEITFTEMRYST